MTSTTALPKLLSAYDSDDSNTAEYDNPTTSTGQDSQSEASKPIDPSFSIASSITIDSAPVVVYSKDQQDEPEYIDENCKELNYNPRYDQLWTPKLGPINPNVTQFQRAIKNTLTGYVEPAVMSDFHFETQRRTYNSYGYAVDPTTGASADSIVGDVEAAARNNFATVIENKKSMEHNKRKRENNNDPTDVDGFLGPWAPYEGLSKTAKPTAEEQEELRQIVTRRNRFKKREEPIEEPSKSILHIDNPFDYAGRSFLHIPQDVGVNLRSEEPPEKCFLPKKILHTYTGHTKGIQTVKYFPVSAHLFLSCSMDSKVKLWEVYKERRCIRTYSGHAQGVRDIAFNRDGTQFLSASFDRNIKLWDTETGSMKAKFTNKKIPYCVVFNPDEDKQHLFVAGTADKKILCWDIRSGEIVQEYDRHLGAVNSITFVDQNRRIVTTSDDKSIRAWEWDIPVDFKYIADPSMHSMPTVAVSRNGRYLAFQSMDNQIKIMEPGANFRWKKKTFRGHMVAGYACGLDISPDNSFMCSGDASGRLIIWDWKSTKILARLESHKQVCMDVKWHPHEASKLLTCGWDGNINLWD